MGELVQHRADYTPWQLAGIVGVKLVALVIAAAAGFRGGRIFPAVFIGAAVGVLANALVPVHPACRRGRVRRARAHAGDRARRLDRAVHRRGCHRLAPPSCRCSCLVILPTWLMVSRAPEMLIKPA